MSGEFTELCIVEKLLVVDCKDLQDSSGCPSTAWDGHPDGLCQGQGTELGLANDICICVLLTEIEWAQPE